MTSKRKQHKPTARVTGLPRKAALGRSVQHRSGFYADLVANAPVALVVWHLEDLDDPATLRFVAVNAAACHVIRLSAEQMLGKLLLDIAPRIFKTDIPQRYAQVVRSGQPQVIDELRYEADRLPEAVYRIQAFPLAGHCVGVAFEDISSRKHAEQMVQKILGALAPTIGVDYFRALVSHLTQSCQAGFAFVGRLNPVNHEQIQAIAVANHDQLLDNFVYDLRHTPCERIVGQSFCYFSGGVRELFPLDTMLQTMGVDTYMGIPLQSSQGKPIGLIALLNDKPLAQPEQAETILRVVAARAAAELDRQLSEEALRASEEFLRMSQRAGNVGSWQWDLKTNAVQWSDSMYSLYGIAPADFDGTLASATRTTHPDDIPIMSEAISKTISEGTGIAFEYRVMRDTHSRDKNSRDASSIGHLWSHSYVICDDVGTPTHVVGTVVDLTMRKQAEEERKKLETQIQQAQKLESLGVLAGGIAHDFNNILTGLLGYADLSLQELPAHSPARPLIGEAVKAARRAAELTKQMLAYSGRGHFVVDAVNLNSVIEDMAPLLQVSITKKCSLTYNFMPDLPAIEADAVQVRQIIMNLIINAAESIGDRNGVIEVTTGSMQCDRDYLSASYLSENLSEGHYAYVQVSDTGCGMSEETRAKIFDPFFTTKFTGRGLGLAAVLGIVRGHRGALTVTSELGKGTVFKIAFPASALKATPESSQRIEQATWRGVGTILIVDDEEAIRSLASRMLERMGFATLTASDGLEAVKIFRDHSANIQLVLLDMTMPNLNGEETFDQLRAIRADVQAILSSGYDEQSATRRFAGKGLAGFIQKPYTYEQLMTACRSALNNMNSRVAPLT